MSNEIHHKTFEDHYYESERLNSEARKELSMLRTELEETKKQLNEARALIGEISKQDHPYTVHEHRDDLEGRFGKQIDLAKQFLTKHPDRATGAKE